MQKVCVRWSPTLGELESTHQKVWGTKEYNPKKDNEKPCVFFGVYGLPDFYALWRHKGKRYILWAGTDITHFKNKYWLDGKGKMRIDNRGMAEWINKYCDNWCENVVEYETLAKLGIKSKICPSFLGDVNKFKVTYKHSDRPKIYASVSGNEFEKYGWYTIERIADKCEADFYLYGNTKPWKTRHKNVFVRGRVPKEVMNSEIKNMQAGLRAIDFDGFSEIVAKAILMGQYPISAIPYKHIDSYKDDKELINIINSLKDRKKPNLKTKSYYLKKINSFKWVNK